ncbi:HDOD domain-containing protein [Luteimonas yindakuii]|nr:HDOD domain-containing protein [Luteimonas yindakuii]
MGTGLLAAALAVVAWWWRRASSTRHVVDAMPAQCDADATSTTTVAPPERGWPVVLLELALGPSTVDGRTEAHDEAIVAAGRSLERFASEPNRLPRRPQLLPQLLGALNDETSSASQLAALVGRDPALAANLLRLANSALYRIYPAPVESLERAVTLIGMQGMRQLVALALMQPVMRADGGVFGRLPDLVWEHTQYATLAAREQAARVHGVDAFAVQLLVLLQGLGAIVVVQALRDEHARRDLVALPLPAIADLLHHWAPRLGRLVAQGWDLPARTWQAFERAGPGSELATVVQAACGDGAAALDAVHATDATRSPAQLALAAS